MPEEFEFSTWLRPGAERAYESLHRAIPADLDAAMRAAGVRDWRIHRFGTRLVHRVVAEDRDLMTRRLDGDPRNRQWQEEVSVHLREGGEPDATEPDDGDEGTLVWELSWATR